MSASFGELLRRGRDEAGLSQSRLGHLIGKSPTTIRSWEHGRSNPSDPQTVAAIAAVLALDEVELLNTAGFEATPVKAHPSARQELTSLASERTDLIVPVPEPAMPANVSAPPALPAPPDSPVLDSSAVAEWPRVLEVTDEAREVPIVVVPPKPVPPIEAETELKVTQADIPIEVAPNTPVAAIPDLPSSSATIPEPRTQTTRPKVRMVVRHPEATPNQGASNGFVVGLSYLEDKEEKEFYRRRGLITAAVLVFMVIVIWWALGRTGGAIGDFIESIVGLLDI